MSEKYYKILFEDLIHNGYTYHEGLNIDPQPWEEEECEPGGFYFTTIEHIFEFCDYGTLICDITIPDDAKVKHYYDKSKADKVVVSNIRQLWNVNTIKGLINHGADIHADNDYALRCASGNGHTEIVKLLLEHGADIHADNDDALRWASKNGHTDTVNLLKSYM